MRYAFFFLFILRSFFPEGLNEDRPGYVGPGERKRRGEEKEKEDGGREEEEGEEEEENNGEGVTEE